MGSSIFPLSRFIVLVLFKNEFSFVFIALQLHFVLVKETAAEVESYVSFLHYTITLGLGYCVCFFSFSITISNNNSNAVEEQPMFDKLKFLKLRLLIHSFPNVFDTLPRFLQCSQLFLF